MQLAKRVIDNIKNLNLLQRILYPVLIILFTLLVQVAVSPLHKINEFRRPASEDSLFNAEFDSIWDHPDLSEMVKEKTFREALLKLSEKDSIQMTVNLSDSTVCLYIKGVKIHQARTNRFEEDKLFNQLTNKQYIKLFEQPLKINSQFATIVKEPVVVRHAPKDTLEAILNAWKPDTLFQNPAFVQFKLEYGIKLIFEQEYKAGFKNKWVRFWFYKRIQVSGSVKALGRFISLKKQEYSPTVKISIPVDDLRTIYRALPAEAFVVISLNH
ncbi:MAG: hypothetical protein JW894_07075 [Bacteroidales bacterium]|nr:hypothetical protein [Bacteroidales bacterium]